MIIIIIMASAASTLQLQDHILASANVGDDSLVVTLKSRWEATYCPAPVAQLVYRQSSYEIDLVCLQRTRRFKMPRISSTA